MEYSTFQDCDRLFVEVESSLFDGFNEPLGSRVKVVLISSSQGKLTVLGLLLELVGDSLLVFKKQIFVALTNLFDLVRKLFPHPNGSFHVLSLFINTIIFELF